MTADKQQTTQHLSAIRAEWEAPPGDGPLAAVRDPSDTRGLKNLYLQEAFVQTLQDELPLAGQETVLDLGCGSGMLSQYFAQRAGRVVGVDVAMRMLEMAAERRTDNTLFALYNGDRLPLAPAAIDLAVCCLVLYQLNNDVVANLAHETHRVLRQDGILFCIEHMSNNPANQDGRGGKYQRSSQNMIELFGRAGLVCDEHYPVVRSRSLKAYLIRYGFFPESKIAEIARRERRALRDRQAYETNRYVHYAYRFRRP